MPDPVWPNVSTPEAAAVAIGEKAGTAVLAARRLADRLHERWEEINSIIVNQASRLPDLKQELCDDAGYLADRARYYHETRPVNALGVVVAAAFVLGIAIGLGRR